MRISVVAACLTTFLTFTGCHDPHHYDRTIKELDSLRIVVQQALDHFEKTDSAACYAAYSKQYSYAGYINTHLTDTLMKEEAASLQVFYLLGDSFHAYFQMYGPWRTEARKSIHQLNSLVADLKSGRVKGEEAIRYIGEEKKQAERIIAELNTNTDIMLRQMEAYNRTLPIAEMVIRHINENRLPDLVQPEIIAVKKR